jgi:hypothetical protein
LTWEYKHVPPDMDSTTSIHPIPEAARHPIQTRDRVDDNHPDDLGEAVHWTVLPPSSLLGQSAPSDECTEPTDSRA